MYFSSDEEVCRRQQRTRFPPEASVAELPSDAQAVIILVELIHHPRMGVDELGAELRKKGYAIEIESIAALFKEHQIGKKKPNTRS